MSGEIVALILLLVVLLAVSGARGSSDLTGDPDELYHDPDDEAP